jgi:hypothetical protein
MASLFAPTNPLSHLKPTEFPQSMRSVPRKNDAFATKRCPNKRASSSWMQIAGLFHRNQ